MVSQKTMYVNKESSARKSRKTEQKRDTQNFSEQNYLTQTIKKTMLTVFEMIF